MDKNTTTISYEESSFERKEDPDSVISIFFDMFNIKKILKTIFNLIRVKTTDSFISGIILIIFLWFLYHFTLNSTDIGIFEISFPPTWPMIIFWIIIIFVVVDLLASNVGSIKKYLFNEEKNKAFLENLKSYPANKIEDEIILRKLSSSNINYYLDLVKEDPTYENAFILDYITRTDKLTIDNFNRIFTFEILKFFSESSIIRILLYHQNKLSENNLKNLFEYFKCNELIIKMIFATQDQTELLIRSDINLKRFYDEFEMNKTENFDLVKTEMERKIHINLTRFSTPLLVVSFFVSLFLLFPFFMNVFHIQNTTTYNIPFTLVIIGSMIIPFSIIFGGFYLYIRRLSSQIRCIKKEFIDLVKQIKIT